MKDKDKIRILDIKLTCLVDLLEKRGILFHEEWDKAVAKEIEETKDLKKLE